MRACSGAESGKAGEVSFLILYRADAASYQKYNNKTKKQALKPAFCFVKNPQKFETIQKIMYNNIKKKNNKKIKKGGSLYERKYEKYVKGYIKNRIDDNGI